MRGWGGGGWQRQGSLDYTAFACLLGEPPTAKQRGRGGGVGAHGSSHPMGFFAWEQVHKVQRGPWGWYVGCGCVLTTLPPPGGGGGYHLLQIPRQGLIPDAPSLILPQNQCDARACDSGLHGILNFRMPGPTRSVATRGPAGSSRGRVVLTCSRRAHRTQSVSAVEVA